MLEASAKTAKACRVWDGKLVATGFTIASPPGVVLVPAAIFPFQTALLPAWGSTKT